MNRCICPPTDGGGPKVVVPVTPETLTPQDHTGGDTNAVVIIGDWPNKDETQCSEP